MTEGRRSGAPRLIEWTGERCVPWAPDVQVVYEHLHRYLWASVLVAGRRVLDLASGEGFGAAILARSAASVTGLDIDPVTVDHSSLNYATDRIQFAVADAADLSAYDDASFGAVVAFEMIEHVDDQARVMDEIARVLAPDGVLIMSTPDRRAYSAQRPEANPFHVHELELEEFRELLAGSFEHIGVWGQRTITGSALSRVEAGEDPGFAPARTFFVEPQGDEWSVAPSMSAVYLVAVASRKELPAIPRESTLADGETRLVRAAEAEARSDLATQQQSAHSCLEAVQAQLDDALSGTATENRERVALAHALEQRDAELLHLVPQITAVEAELGGWRQHAATENRERVALARELEQRDAELLHRRAQITAVETELGAWRQRAATLAGDLARAQETASEMTHSLTWKAFRRIRRVIFAGLGGPQSGPVRLLQGTIRAAAWVARFRRGTSLPAAPGVTVEEAETPLLEIPQYDEPTVSLVIPVYSGAELTLAGLRSIVENTSRVRYEVIVVDDGADAATKGLLARVRGARIMVNNTNRGYLKSVNEGAAAARGEWIVLCNNDIEVLDGWCRALLECGQSSPDIAVVTPKYLYPDRSVNEAGGIIWQDGTGMNYGRGRPASLFHYAFRREVDYGSAAALMVRGSFWRDVGGFDERYLPMYYEDTDLCFRARESGLRVVYEPRAEVVHVEGGTAGTDITAGHKRFQEINRAKFSERWQSQLARQLPAGIENARAAADRAHGPRILIVDHRIPMWDRDSGSLRLKGMIDELVALGCRITLLADDRQPNPRYAEVLQAMGVEVWDANVNVRGELEAIGSDLTLTILCRPHTTSRWLDVVREFAPAARVIYDTVDLHWVRESRRGDDGNRSALTHGTKSAALRELELALIRASDGTFAISQEERVIIEAEVPGSTVWVAPNVNAIRVSSSALAQRSGVVFVGGFEHPPNADAVIRLVNGVMPGVWRELGDVPVTIVGGDPPPQVRALASDRVRIAGWVPDLDPLLDQSRVLVAPLTWGAGLKGKVTQALAIGLPVVTTSIGAEGLGATDGRELLIADDDTGMTERVIKVLTDDAIWRALSSSGQDAARRVCSPAVMHDVLREVLRTAGISPSEK